MAKGKTNTDKADQVKGTTQDQVTDTTKTAPVEATGADGNTTPAAPDTVAHVADPGAEKVEVMVVDKDQPLKIIEGKEGEASPEPGASILEKVIGVHTDLGASGGDASGAIAYPVTVIPKVITLTPGAITPEQIDALGETIEELGYQITPIIPAGETIEESLNIDLYDEEFEDEAAEHMEAQNLPEIWRCPVSGYWFSRKDYADTRAKEIGRALEHYKK